MRLSAKGRYAVTAMLDLSLYGSDQPVSLASISHRQSISLSYLEQLFVRLRKAGLVSSVRGPGGGYYLGGEIEEISISQIVNAVDESIDTTLCRGKGNCQGGEMCLTHSLWDDLGMEIHRFLSQISLADLVSRKDVQSIRKRQALQAVVLQEEKQTHSLEARS